MPIERSIFTEEHNIFRETVRRFMEKEVAPFHDRWEKEGVVPRELWQKAGATGMLLATTAEAYGGAGADFQHCAIVIEEGTRIGASGLGFQLHSDIVAPYIEQYGSEETRRRWLPRMAKGETVGAICMTEPGTGSDLQGVRTAAKRDGDQYVVSGQKTFITNGQTAELLIVVAKTDPSKGAKGTSLILVESDREGFRRGRNLEKIGMKAQDTSELFFDEVRVPADNLLGEENRGFRYLMEQLPRERLQSALRSVAAAETAIAHTAAYVKEREAFGQKIWDFQNTKFKLAECHAQAAIGRVYVDRCIALLNENRLDLESAAIAKLWCSEMQGRVIDECLQLHGGYGYMWEFPIARLYADARVSRIYAGSSEIMKLIISRHL